MAKKAKTKKRRVGSSKMNPNSNTVKLIAVGAGYLLGDTVNSLLDKIIPASISAPATPPATTGAFDVKKYIVPGAQIGIGGLLLLKGRPTMIKTLAGGLLAGSGLKRLLVATGTVNGYQSVPVIGARRNRMAGYQSVPVVGGIPSQLAGQPGQLQGGFRVNGYVPTGSNKPVLGSVGSVDLRHASEAGAGVEIGSSAGYMR